MALEALIPGRAREISRLARSTDSPSATVDTPPAVLPPVPIEIQEIISVQGYTVDEKNNFRWIRDGEGNIVLKSKPLDRAVPVFDVDDVFPEPVPPTGIRGVLARTKNFFTSSSSTLSSPAVETSQPIPQP
ncbi:MAG: hypothetical protein M1444_00685 [Patescibacteria group bacterium]|nr:hypothetical protein [Patescibacteria group bacterium]